MFLQRSLKNFKNIIKVYQRSIHLEPHKDNLNMAIGDFASLERKYTDSDVRTFSGLCGDENPIHLDEAYGKRIDWAKFLIHEAATTRFKARIVHGIFVASVFSNLCATHFPGSIYMKQDLKFVAPVYLDELVSGKIEIKEVDREKKRIVLETTVTKVAENKPAILGEALIYYEKLGKTTK